MRCAKSEPSEGAVPVTRSAPYRLTGALRRAACGALVCWCAAGTHAALSSDHQFDVINESHSAIAIPGSFTLDQQNAEPGSIMVFVQSPLPPFQRIELIENVDYAVIPAGAFSEIRIFTLPPEFVVPGTYDFWVSYFLRCTGDCNADGYVTVDEIITMVNIALGNTDLSACADGDMSGDGQITVDEIITALNNALNGCGVLPPTSQPMPTRT